MRMWMVDPRLMCGRHLLGEHAECHMLAGSLKKGRSVAGYLAKRIIEPGSLGERHGQLSDEMAGRGFRHTSPLPEVHVPPRMNAVKVDPDASREELVKRCKGCREKEEEGRGEGLSGATETLNNPPV